jgi:hypothetical protein
MIPYLLGLVGAYLIGDSSESKSFADGGVTSMHNRIQEYQIKKSDGTYFYVKMSTGSPAWTKSPSMGYLYTEEDAEKIKAQLEKEGETGLSIVKYDKDWWKNAKDEFAEGGNIKLGDVVEVREPNYGRDDSYYVVSNKAGYDENSFQISPTSSRVQGVFEEEQLKKLYADGGSTNSVAEIILKQLGGAGRLNAMTGAYNFRDLGNGLSFKIKNQRANYIKITLNGMDLYDLEVGRTRGTTYKVVASHDNVYFDQLKPLIEKATGMYLSLFDKGGNVNKDNFSKMLYEQYPELKWQDVEIGDSARVKEINKTGVIVKTYGRKFHLKFVDGTEKTYDASELEFFKN